MKSGMQRHLVFGQEPSRHQCQTPHSSWFKGIRRLVSPDVASVDTAPTTVSSYMIRAPSSLSFDSHSALFLFFAATDAFFLWPEAAKGRVLQAHLVTYLRVAGGERRLSSTTSPRITLFHCNVTQRYLGLSTFIGLATQVFFTPVSPVMCCATKLHKTTRRH